jgi:predicted SnoaL-like aldol condensation-catalyzing enzyme
MVALYADDAVHSSPRLRAQNPAGRGRIVGRAAMKQWWSEAFDRQPELRYAPVAIVTDDRYAVIEYDRHAPGEATTSTAEVFEIKGGKIVRSHVYLG